MSRACGLALRRDTFARQLSQYNEALNYTESKLEYARQKLAYLTQSPDTKDSEDIAELYRIAGLIYIRRAGKGLSSSSPKVRSIVEAGLKIGSRLQTCFRALPMFILGCEANTDRERLIILDLLRRTQACRTMASITGAQQFIEASWAQDDLRLGEDMDYIKRLDAVMSSSESVPSFA